MRISDVRVIGSKAPQSTKRIVFGWQNHQNLVLREGDYEALFQLGDSPPFWRDFHISAGQTEIVSLDVQDGTFPIRVVPDAARTPKRIAVVYRGIEMAKWFYQRGLRPLPSGGLVASNHSIDRPQRAGVIKDVSADGVFDLGFAPEQKVHIIVLDEFGIWSAPVAVEPDELQPERELKIYPQWPNSIILKHPASFGYWVEVRVSGDKVHAQVLRQLLKETPLSVTGSGDVSLLLTYIDGDGNSAEAELHGTVDPHDTRPVYLDVPVPD